MMGAKTFFYFHLAIAEPVSTVVAVAQLAREARVRALVGIAIGLCASGLGLLHDMTSYCALLQHDTVYSLSAHLFYDYFQGARGGDGSDVEFRGPGRGEANRN